MYEKLVETRIIRIKHKISFRAGMSATTLREMLKHVPDDAIIEDINEENNGGSIYFYQEERVD